jgi:guanylate kinase
VTDGLAGRTFPLVLAAPSGAGKTTIARALRERRKDVVFSVSATTRPPRPGERDGVDYHFVDHAEFRRMIEAGELIEWAEVHGNLYGTPLRNVADAVARREYLLLDIDVQGARQIRRKLPEAVFVFVLPPSGQALVERLAGRGSEDAEVRLRRLANARDEIREAAHFDFAVVNDDLGHAVDEVERILLAETRRVSRIPALQAEIARMCGDIEGYLGAARG